MTTLTEFIARMDEYAKGKYLTVDSLFCADIEKLVKLVRIFASCSFELGANNLAVKRKEMRDTQVILDEAQKQCEEILNE